jgi:hypothetical protein
MGLLISPVLATKGTVDGSNCQFQLPYTINDLLEMRDDMSKDRNAEIRIELVNACTNQSEMVRIDSISNFDSSIQVAGYVEGADGARTWRYVTIAK